MEVSDVNISRQRRRARLLEIFIRLPICLFIEMLFSNKYSFSIDGWSFLTYFVTTLMGLRSGISAVKLSWDFTTFCYKFLNLIGLVFGLLVFMQSRRNLRIFYFFLFSASVLIWSYVLNSEFYKYCLKLKEQSSLQSELFNGNVDAIYTALTHYVSQTIFSLVFWFCTMNLPNFPHVKILVGVTFILPTLLNVVISSYVFIFIPPLVALLSCTVVTLYLLKNLPNILQVLYVQFSFVIEFYELYGISGTIAYVFQRYPISGTLQMYCSLRLFNKFIYFMHEDMNWIEYVEIESLNNAAFRFSLILNKLLLNSCDNIILLSGTAMLLAVFVDKFIYIPVQNFLYVPHAEQKRIKTNIFCLVIAFALQRGITYLDTESRNKVLESIAGLCVCMVLDSINSHINSILTTLSLTGNRSFVKHLKVLLSAALIFFGCITWLLILWHNLTHNSFFLAIIFLIIEIVVSVLISCFIYILNVIHIFLKDVWLELDDYIYCLESTKNLVNFILGVLILMRGTYTFFEYGSLLRLIFLVAHLYCNIYFQFMNAYNSLFTRLKILCCARSLPIASEEEKMEADDVCSICYENLSIHNYIVRIARCNHFFHEYCLRRWLNEQRKCPICHRSVLQKNYESWLIGPYLRI